MQKQFQIDWFCSVPDPIFYMRHRMVGRILFTTLRTAPNRIPCIKCLNCEWSATGWFHAVKRLADQLIPFYSCLGCSLYNIFRIRVQLRDRFIRKNNWRYNISLNCPFKHNFPMLWHFCRVSLWNGTFKLSVVFTSAKCGYLKAFLKQLLFRSSETVVWITPEGSYTLLEKFWRISQYLTGESIAKLSVTKKFFK